MKKKIDIIKKTIVYIAIIILLFSVIFLMLSISLFNDGRKSILGYRTYLVLSDSMKDDFKSGDLIIVKDVDYNKLKPGDIISYISRAKYNYGDTVTHKIRSIIYDEDGKPGFITYGTTTGNDDEGIVEYPYIIGKYQFKIKNVANIIMFLKTIPGYLIFVLIPFLTLIILQVIDIIKTFKIYHINQLEELRFENEKIILQYKNLEKELDELKKSKKKKTKKKTSRKKTNLL